MSLAVDHGNHSSHATRYAELNIESVRESAHNPRRHFDDAKLKELADNILQVGILSPLLVRPDPDSTPKQPRYEIAAGHRRYRAAKLLSLAFVPCLVREMTDQEFMELLNIENLQREGLHPLDEAKGYEVLMAAPYKMSVERIAEKVGRSVKYVYDRVKLLQLNKDARGLFWAGKIEAGHAILLARLTPADQAKAIGTKAADYEDGGLLQLSHDLYAEDDGRDEPDYKAVSVRELESWIKRHIRFNAKEADSFLFPETVAKVTEATEGKKKIIEITREYLASDEVRQAGDTRVYGERAWKRADGKEDSKTCERSVLGVIASGHGQGEAFQVCINKDRCTVHWGAEIKAREKRAKATPEERAKADVKQEAERKKQEEAYELERRKRAEWAKLEPAIMNVVESKLATISAKATGPLADLLIKALSDWGRAKTSLKRGTSEADLIRYLAALALGNKCRVYDAYQQFPKLAKTLGIDLSSVLPAKHVQATPEKPKAKKKGKAA
jgi:ParB/RepB/Spo0J family partition protein